MLDVGPSDGSQNPRLVVFDKRDALSEPYIALSYCWGKKNSFVTARRNIKDRIAGIQFEKLPKTFQDAILVTRCLGMHYLWIDALCIVQDDYNDWVKEAANMASVYQGAILTISATNSSAVTEGFLKPRLHVIEKAVKSVLWVSPSGQSFTVHVRTRLKHEDIVPETTSTSTQDNPLLSRGWAFQERLLSTRTLHFLAKELLWECRCQYWCECMSVTADQSWKVGVLQGSLFNRATLDPRATMFYEYGWDEPTSTWQTMVSEYSKRQLTYRDDRLPALSGIASRFISFDLGGYYAGIWSKNLLCHLSWQS
ncbi:HET-domain-containing protein, partial [Mytilinidion resinicola]